MGDHRCTIHSRRSPEDGALLLYLLEVVDGRASYMAVHIEEDGEACDLLSDQEAKSRQHTNTACNQEQVALISHRHNPQDGEACNLLSDQEVESHQHNDTAYER